MRIRRITVSFVAALTFAAPAPTGADQVDDAYEAFIAGRYEQVFPSLLAYRLQHEGTLRVDFMLAVSACRLSDGDFRALGGFLLAAIPNWYKPLPAQHMEDIRRQAEACPSTGITEEQAIARVSGKTDTGGAERLTPKRSGSGKDQALPPAPPSASSMGPLVKGKAYDRQADYIGATAASATECSALCARDARCAAMTFVVSQKLCLLKERVSATRDHGDAISAAKLPRQ